MISKKLSFIFLMLCLFGCKSISKSLKEYTIQIPTNWSSKKKYFHGGIVRLIYSPNEILKKRKSKKHASFFIYKTNDHISLKGLILKKADYQKSISKNYTFELFKNNKGYVFLEKNFGIGKSVIYVKSVYLDFNTFSYVLRFSAEKEEYEKYISEIDTIFSTFKMK